MQFRIVAITAVLVGLLALAPSAGAAVRHIGPQHCKAGFKIRTRLAKRNGKIVRISKCVKRHLPLGEPPKAVPSPGKKLLIAHLDGSKRNPLDPFTVSYDYSAEASEEVAGKSATVAPPSGVLSLYSDGALECSVNVGSQIGLAECPVQYQELGDHRVTVIYSSGSESATETRIERISPYPTSTELALSFTGETPEPVSGSSWYKIGQITYSRGSVPSGLQTDLQCDGQPVKHDGRLTDTGCLLLDQQKDVATVYEWPGGCNDGVRNDGSVAISSEVPTGFGGQTPDSSLEPLTQEGIEAGTYYVRAVVNSNVMVNPGYAPSEIKVPLQFSTLWPCNV